MKLRLLHCILLCGVLWLSACQQLGVLTHPTAPTQQLPAITFQLAGLEFDRPGFVFALPDQRVAVIEQRGTIALLADGSQWLDVRPYIADTAPERGLLGVAIDPTARWVFVSYSRAVDAATTIARIPLIRGVPQVDSLQEIYVVPQPYPNHNGGHIAFGPDGLLYIGLGDGGSGGDPDKVARNPASPLGKLVRIDVRNDEVPYRIPTGQPVHRNWLPEVVAQGLRNPWRFGFGADGSFWVADVGQGRYEELSVMPLSQLPGADFGWSEREGAHCFDASQSCLSTGLVDPVTAYDHSAGHCSITGGAVVSSRYAGLGGAIMYGDFCAGTIYVWDPLNGATLLTDTDYQIASFGTDADGNLYISDYSTGNVYRIVLADA
ncbi:MAG: PQQ-dependent sugar dehydrogenase [Roseiflexaceae bacterium]